MATNDLLLPKRETWKSLNIEDLIVQDQTIVENLMVEGDLELKSGNYTSTLETATLTDNRTITFPDSSGIVGVFSDPSNVVTQISTNTSGNVMAGSGGKVIQGSGIPVATLMSGPTTSVRTIYARYHPTGGTLVLDIGYGFGTPTYNNVGSYDLVFSPAFTEQPNVQLTIIQGDSVPIYPSITQRVLIFTGNITTTGCRVYIIDPSTSWYNYRFSILVTGK